MSKQSELDPALQWVDASHTVKASELKGRKLYHSLVTGQREFVGEMVEEGKPKGKFKGVVDSMIAKAPKKAKGV